VDKDGSISLVEFKKILGLPSEQEDRGDDSWSSVLSTFDVDKNGLLEFHEFRQMMQKFANE
jgi:Ca2+-binding EF-hand superfamily protein